MNNLILTIKSWNIKNAYKLKEKDKSNNWEIISDKKDFNIENISKINPEYIFVPHWSWKIPEEVFKNYETIIFHPTDLPFGRGGTPIQNLITQRIYDTKISAIKATNKMDAGPIYLKKDFNISQGNIEEILGKASNLYFNEMIPKIMNEKINPIEQEGKIVEFVRRKPNQSNFNHFLEKNPSEREIYDFIRMLDGEGYPRAYIENNLGKFELYGAKLNGNILETKIKKI